MDINGMEGGAQEQWHSTHSVVQKHKFYTEKSNNCFSLQSNFQKQFKVKANELLLVNTNIRKFFYDELISQ
jgi:hypothetical protein